ncbi:MAG TPA: FG-GAP-like repeat-containing protein [Saprospiraceae bacterium]|nr:FG-GAP-like repeat-containing protein [Saprospiraceae bacterium]HMQ84055.1 FG-GAP-like repeat-containing protein [Saprospiraceae bacterium]
MSNHATLLRQFRFWTKKINLLLAKGQFGLLAKEEQFYLIQKLQQLYRSLLGKVASAELRKTLAGAAIFIGIHLTAVQAQDFAPALVNPFGLDGGQDGYAGTLADIDGDGDQDYFYSSYDFQVGFSRKLYFSENTGTLAQPQFATGLTDFLGFDSPENVTIATFADIDGDGDLDMLLGTFGFSSSQELLYYQNTGTANNPAFAPAQNSPFGMATGVYNIFPHLVDIDNDGDYDLLAGTANQSTGIANIQFQENTGSANSPQFQSPQVNPFGIDNQLMYQVIPTTGDVDLDGDLDLMYSGLPYDYNQPASIYYQSNIGTPDNPNFSPPAEDPFGIGFGEQSYLSIPYLVDFDGDGDMDLFCNVYYYGDTYETPILYFENNAIEVATQETLLEADFRVFPSPASERISWEWNGKNTLEISALRIYSANGQLVFSRALTDGTYNGHTEVSFLPNGLYQIALLSPEGREIISKRFIVNHN